MSSWTPAGDNWAVSANSDSAPQSSATGGSMRVERPLFPEYLQPPPGFGKLSTVYDQPRGHTPRDGVHTFVVARSGAAAGTADHGIDRGNGIKVEKSRKEPLNHPEFKGYYNYEGRKFKELTAFEKRQLEMAVHYPNIQKGIMKAPFCFRKGSLSLPKATQSKLFQQVFGTPEIFDEIFAHLITRYEDLTSLSAASQFTAYMVQSSWMYFDATGMDFLGWDKNCLSDVRQMEEKRSSGKGKARISTRTFSPTIIISPIRPEEQGPMIPVTTNKAGYPLNPGVKLPERTGSFEVSMTAHYKLLHFSYLNGYAVKHLVLHGMPWVTIASLQSIISRMPRLEALGVHQCFLLTFGDTQPFLRAINAINEDRSNLAIPRPHIGVDYSPFYYRGPPYKADGSGHVGEYGVVPEEKAWLDYKRAIPAQLFGIWDLCYKGRQDFFTPGTGFRAFLDRIPLRGMSDILKCIAAVHDFNNNKHHAGVCTQGLGKPPFVSEELEQAMGITVWQDLIIACTNRPMLEEKLRELLVLRRKVKLHRCRQCEMCLPAYFFMAHVLAWREQDVICHGCQLQERVVKQVWLLYNHRRILAESIFKNGYKELSLCRVLKRIGKPARAEVKDGKPAREAIPSLPGAVDVSALGVARELWELLTVGIPALLDSIHEHITAIDRTYHKLPFEERLTKSAEKDMLSRKALWCEVLLGINQRKSNNGSLEVTCSSWEQLIRENRADIAIQRGFTNRGPMYILNFRANAVSMLGRSGGLKEYWNESDEESGPSDDSSSLQKLSNNLLLPHQRPKEASQVETTSMQSQKKLLPHQRRPNKPPQSIENVPESEQSTTNSEQKLLPHQRQRPPTISQPPVTASASEPPSLKEDSQPTIHPIQNLYTEIAGFMEKYDTMKARVDQAQAEFDEWKEGVGAEAFQKIVHETIKLQEEAETAVIAKTGIPPPPPWLMNAAVASRSSPHQGWIRMLEPWKLACSETQ
ncbi:hypothetical protein F4679DRAFT_599206 [Xylaria curta]|nr:hypothetical protein F4679DRAFT_599206 [Xylaria curta]